MTDHTTPPWYVLTAGPSAGKTTLLEELARRGYCTVPEMARAYLNSERAKGRSIEEIRSDEIAFQYRLLPLKRAAEARAPRNEIVFFDRGMHDTIAYLRALGIALDRQATQHIIGSSRYRKMFLLDMLPFVADDVRIESIEQVERIHNSLLESYQTSGIPVIRVPVLPIAERANFILQNL